MQQLTAWYNVNVIYRNRKRAAGGSHKKKL